MNEQEMPTIDPDESLKYWRQGDFAYSVGGFLYAGIAVGDEPYKATDNLENVVGLIVISQTCDIVRRTGGRNYLSVSPLFKKNVKELSNIQHGRRPYLVEVENTDEEVVADLSCVMSVHKDVVRTWKRQTGFNDMNGRLRFAAALERKFGQFAFPDEFDEAIKKFRQRIWERHNKQAKAAGKIYRSLAQIRFQAYPDWTDDNRKITVIAVMKENREDGVERDDIYQELEDQLEKIKWPRGYEWGDPNFVLGTAKDLSAEDIIEIFIKLNRPCMVDRSAIHTDFSVYH